jgi:hypothetical protein
MSHKQRVVIHGHVMATPVIKLGTSSYCYSSDEVWYADGYSSDKAWYAELLLLQ